MVRQRKPHSSICENPILSRPMFRELGRKHNWKEDNPEHVSLSSDEKVLEDYYSRSIIQFRVKRNDRGSRKRTSPEIRTRKRTKGDFLPPPSPPTPFLPLLRIVLPGVYSPCKTPRRNFIQSPLCTMTCDAENENDFPPRRSRKITAHLLLLELTRNDMSEKHPFPLFLFPSFPSSWWGRRKMAQREIAISPCGLGKYLPGGLRSSSRLPSRPFN